MIVNFLLVWLGECAELMASWQMRKLEAGHAIVSNVALALNFWLALHVCTRF